MERLWAKTFIFTTVGMLFLFTGFYMLLPTLPLFIKQIGGSEAQVGLVVGAYHYFSTSDAATFTELADRFDHILNTMSANLDVDAYLSLLRVDGTLVNVGAPTVSDTYNVFSLLMKRRSIAGSLVGGIRETQEMLDFSAEHGIAPKIEAIGADQVDAAYQRILRNG